MRKARGRSVYSTKSTHPTFPFPPQASTGVPTEAGGGEGVEGGSEGHAGDPPSLDLSEAVKMGLFSMVKKLIERADEPVDVLLSKRGAKGRGTRGLEIFPAASEARPMTWCGRERRFSYCGHGHPIGPWVPPDASDGGWVW
jgi:hypothetical protein